MNWPIWLAVLAVAGCVLLLHRTRNPIYIVALAVVAYFALDFRFWPWMQWVFWALVILAIVLIFFTMRSLVLWIAAILLIGTFVVFVSDRVSWPDFGDDTTQSTEAPTPTVVPPPTTSPGITLVTPTTVSPTSTSVSPSTTTVVSTTVAPSTTTTVAQTTSTTAAPTTTTTPVVEEPLPPDEDGLVDIVLNDDGTTTAVGPTDEYLASSAFNCGGRKDAPWLQNPTLFEGTDLLNAYRARPKYRDNDMKFWAEQFNPFGGKDFFVWMIENSTENPLFTETTETWLMDEFASKLQAGVPQQTMTLRNFTCKGDDVRPNGYLEIGGEGRFAMFAGLVLDGKALDAVLAETNHVRSDLPVYVFAVHDSEGKDTGMVFVEFKAAGCLNNEIKPPPPPPPPPCENGCGGGTTTTVPVTTIPTSTTGRKGSVPTTTPPPAVTSSTTAATSTSGPTGGDSGPGAPPPSTTVKPKPTTAPPGSIPDTSAPPAPGTTIVGP